MLSARDDQQSGRRWRLQQNVPACWDDLPSASDQQRHRNPSTFHSQETKRQSPLQEHMYDHNGLCTRIERMTKATSVSSSRAPGNIMQNVPNILA